MKKLLFLFSVALAALTGCEGGGDTSGSVVLTGGTSTTQTIYSDETQKTDGIKFTAEEDWTATVNATATKTAGSNVDWLKLSQYEGGAGEFSLSLTLLPNDTGKDRTATIKIICGDTTITITVEQKGYKKGEEPTPDDKPVPVVGSLVDRITYEATSNNMHTKGERIFKYDDKLRLVEMTNETTESYIGGGGPRVDTESYTLTYGDGTISYEYKINGDMGYEPGVSRVEVEELRGKGSCVLDKAGRVISGTYSYCVEKEGTWNEPQDYTLKYNADGYLIECNGSDSRPHSRTVSQWSNGNLTEIWWGDNGSDTCRDWAVYGATQNRGWLDITPFLLYHFEGFAFSAGDPDMLFSVTGNTGKRSGYMPVKIFSRYNSSVEYNHRREYEYKTNNEGYVVQIIQKVFNNGEQQNRTYNITYRK